MVEMTASLPEQEMGGTVSVLLSVPPSRSYDYQVPSGLRIAPGDFVDVPLAGRTVLGVVWGPSSGDVPLNRLKKIITKRSLDGLTCDLRNLVAWVSEYYLVPPGMVLRMVLSVPGALKEPTPTKLYKDAGSRPNRLTPQRTRVFRTLRDGRAHALSNILRDAQVSSGVVQSLAAGGHLITSCSYLRLEDKAPDPDHSIPKLSRDQELAANSLRREVETAQFRVKLLDGVTGAGKTEVYFEAIGAALKLGCQTLILVPEIALTEDWVRRFESRFGVRPWTWHSEIGSRTRRENWRRASSSLTGVCVGTRSALFLPFRNLGLIVVDEEHDPSYKQEEGVFYNARDVAIMRGRFASCPVVLVSATPSLETHHNVSVGRYGKLVLAERFGGSSLPVIEAVDMRQDRPAPGRWISPSLDNAVRETISEGHQALLFLNRRGYAPLTLCGSCGFRVECQFCSAWLVEHRERSRLSCHHCGHEERRPDSCPRCGLQETMVACGPGVERLAEELSKFIPHARVHLMTSDTVRSGKDVEVLVQKMLTGAVDILIGTQMVTKGFHFPSLTLVGVVDADLGLSGGNLRAGERSMQLLSQVSGRAGRELKSGRAILQTYLPEHPVMNALTRGDRDMFVAEELEARREARMPPFSRLAGLIISSIDRGLASETARILVRNAPDIVGLEVFGPAPAPISLLRGKYRFRVLIRAPRKFGLQRALRAWLAQVRWPKKVIVRVDVDPYNFL